MPTVFYDDHREPYHTAIHDRVASLGDEDVLQTSAIVLCELEYSYFNAPQDKKAAIRTTIDAIGQDFDAVLPIEQEHASVFGELKANLGKEKRLSRKEMRRHNVDVLLASSAIVTSSVLVGMDRIYEEIARFHDQFRCENWLIGTYRKDPTEGTA